MSRVGRGALPAWKCIPAIAALGAIGFAANDQLDLLRSLNRDAEVRVRLAALEAARQIGAAATPQ